MAKTLQPARGTKDLLPRDNLLFRHIDQVAWTTAQRFGFSELIPPIFEFTEVFSRSLGETSDVVHKEMYTFQDKGGEWLTLRPEGTAGIIRAVVSNGLAQNLPLRLYYNGAMFRHERPQRGRYRQFHQIGAEVLGFESPWADVEALSLAAQILGGLGIMTSSSTPQPACQLEINTLGDRASRESYKAKLTEFLSDYKQELSADSQMRLEKNPLRILDTKDEKDKAILQKAPLMQTSISAESLEFFGKVQEGLTALGIPFVINDRLVRGLDYYTHTVFEFTTDQLGAQSAILAGGRYEGLMTAMGGKETPGVGWACGIERLALLLEERYVEPASEILAVIAADETCMPEAQKLAHLLRQSGKNVDQIFTGNMGKKFKRADKVQATYALIIGETEKQNQTVGVKNLKTGEQKSVPMADIVRGQGLS